MQTAKGKVVEGGRMILPAAFRRSLGLEKGDTVVIELHEDELRLRPARSALRRLQVKLRALPTGGGLASDELVAERRVEAAREASEGAGSSSDEDGSEASTIGAAELSAGDDDRGWDRSCPRRLRAAVPAVRGAGRRAGRGGLGLELHAAANLAEVVGKLVDRGVPP